MNRYLAFAVLCLTAYSCNARPPSGENSGTPLPRQFMPPSSIPEHILSGISAQYDLFVAELEEVLYADEENLLILVDKRNFLSPDFEPGDIVPLNPKASYRLNRSGLSLRKSAEEALERMAARALKEGRPLLVSSTYRSWSYQKTVYERHVGTLGKEVADRESATPGSSQHQLGTAVDFGSITDEFALTAAGEWLASNASRFGWSLSYPDGYENATGYRWESWHYRYIGEKACLLQDTWFDGIQQYTLEYIDAWKRFHKE